jgi:hypothetical protein
MARAEGRSVEQRYFVRDVVRVRRGLFVGLQGKVVRVGPHFLTVAGQTPRGSATLAIAAADLERVHRPTEPVAQPGG